MPGLVKIADRENSMWLGEDPIAAEMKKVGLSEFMGVRNSDAHA
jgi:hypothetical protein